MASINELAIFGGKKTISKLFTAYNPIGSQELEAASEVIKSGILSRFIGAWGDDFYGGEKVREFERNCEHYFGVKHAISVNSWTSGLIAAVGAVGVEPGDEVLVPPWTMCASATAILHWNAIPVFVDIDPLTFCMDPIKLEKNISPYTKAIMAVDIFGQSANMKLIMQIAQKHGLKVISDTAQAPGSKYNGEYSGTLADVGGFSLNYHKHIHTGEGGVLVTNDSEIATKLQLIRNHAEAVVGPMGMQEISNMVGYNFRLGEIEAAIGIEQLKKLDTAVRSRQLIALKLNDGLKNLRHLRIPEIESGSSHSYYIYPMLLDSESLGVNRARLVEALHLEGVQGLMAGYQNVHLLPIFQRKIAYGSLGFPWSSDICKRDISYDKGICPVAEKYHDEEFLGLAICSYSLSEEDVGLIVSAFQKVWRNLDSLRRG